MINLEKTKTYCIGRYVVDIPAEANPLERYDKYDSFTTIRFKLKQHVKILMKQFKKWRKEYSEDGNRKIYH